MQKKLVATMFALLLIGISVSSLASAQDDASLDPIEACSQGLSLSVEGQLTLAKRHLEISFATLQADDTIDQTLRGQCSFGLGRLRQSIGDWDGALAAYTVALNDFQAVGDQQLEWGALFGIGSIYMSQGRMDEAKNTLEEALTLLQTSNAPPILASIISLSEASTLNNLANIKSWQASRLPVNDPEAQQLFNEAIVDYEHILEILHALQESSNENTATEDLSTILLQAGLDNPIPVLSHDIQALILNNLGETYRMQTQYAAALDSYEQSLLIAAESVNQQEDTMAPSSRQFGLLNQALARNNMGLLLYEQGNTAGALEQFNQAEMAARQVSNPLFLVSILMSIGTLQQEQGQSVEALVTFEEAMNLLESVRLVTDNQLSQVRASDQTTTSALSGSLVQFADLYQYVAGVYFQMGDHQKAFYTAERGRSRLFLNMFVAGQLQLLDEAGADLLAQEREAFILRTIARDDLARAETLGLDAATIGALSAELDVAEAEYDAILATVESRDDQLAALVSGKTNVLQLSDVQALLDEETTLIIYYQLLDQGRSGLDTGGTLAFVVSQDEVTAVPLPRATTENLATAVTDLHKWINHDNPYPRPLRNLYTWLVAPLEEYIDTPRVGIVPHQSLHYVPFAALTDGKTYFGEVHSLFNLPSASVLPLIQENVASVNIASNKMLVFGNPKTDNLDPLPDAEAEAEAVAALLEAAIYTGSEATESRFWAEVPEARVIHIAAHGIYDEDMPLESTVYLTTDEQQDGRLQVAELYHLDLKAAEMVVLSACQTNVGLVSAGDEVVGLTRAFLNAGTPSIIASLWRVDDKATSALMVAFYRYWLEEGLSKAEALQAAQAHVRTMDDGRYASPFYWAGFVLNGDGSTSEAPAFVSGSETENAKVLPVILYGVVGIVLLWFIGLQALKRFQD